MEPCEPGDICQYLAQYVLLIQAVVLAMIITVNISNLVWRKFINYPMPEQDVRSLDYGDHSKEDRAVPSKVCIPHSRRTKPSDCPRKHRLVPITLTIEGCHNMHGREQWDNGAGCTVANEHRALMPEYITEEDGHCHHRMRHLDRVGRSCTSLLNKTIDDKMKCSSQSPVRHKLYRPFSSTFAKLPDLKSTMSELKPSSCKAKSNQQLERVQSQPVAQMACQDQIPPDHLCTRPPEPQSDERACKDQLTSRPQVVQLCPVAQKDRSDGRPPGGGYCSRTNFRPPVEPSEVRPPMHDSCHSTPKSRPEPRLTRECPHNRCKMEQPNLVFKLSRSPMGTEHSKPPVKESAIPNHSISDTGHHSIINKTDPKATSNACHSNLPLDRSATGMGHVVYDARCHRKHCTRREDAKRYQRSSQDGTAMSPSFNTGLSFVRPSCSSEKGIDGAQASP